MEAKDIAALISLLAPAAVATADGGGLAVSHLHPIVGSEQIARAYATIAVRRATAPRSWHARSTACPAW
ncbi:hypothetical protein [Streptomyces sp. P17]|uniref:hypothetical protein n=1 Tax=Streptomyces sp. P17 TaxID=3074716 RepID=UPI0028F4528D|nr:hypothetical protein [Streptomyces sp. P17]MDT9695321.1 hypothetical protein [Streptomyces sp. P17]